MKKTFIISGTIIIFLISIYFLFNYRKTRQINNKVLNQIEQIEDLITAKQIYREILYSKETKDFLWIPLSNKEFLISVNYIVTAGIDISKGYEVNRQNNIITITLPKADVLSIDADDSSIKEYFIKKRFSELYRDDYFSMIQESKEEILKGESIKILLEESEKSAKTVLETLLGLSGLNVKVKFSNQFIRSID